MKSRLCNILILMSLVLMVASCHQEEEYANDPYGNFDSLWRTIDEHYCFFKYKDIDWDEVGERYRAQLQPGMTATELFDVCASMLKELKDGHTNLISPWDVSRYWIWEQYPVNYDERVIDQYYLNFEYKKACGIKYAVLKNNFGYMYYGDFSVSVGEGNLDMIMSTLASCDGMIVDVRSNGGGLLTNVEPIVARFINQRIHAGAISHKTGPGHDDFSQPYDYYFDAASSGRVKFFKPVVVLANRGSFSATNNFVSVMQSLPQVKVVGDVTGGGCGLPFTGELPNGWSVRYSASAITDSQGRITEFGVEPDYRVDMTAEEIALGKDAILEKAFLVLNDMIANQVSQE
ncbi:MAG: S41 family peptidase [Muribaculaceae bacterium]